MKSDAISTAAAPPAAASPAGGSEPRVRFDRNELSGSFGDIGTDLPLLIGMIPAAGLDSASVFVVFGLVQIASGLLYGLPMPVQPLKAMAVLVITQRLGADVLYGGGLAIGAIMLALSAAGALDWLARLIPHCVVRGVQFGLGLSLAWLALGRYVPAQGLRGYAVAAACFVVMAALWGNRRVPAGLVVIALGLAYALLWQLDAGEIAGGMGLALPTPRLPGWADIATGLWVLALPQLPLSLSNSVIATRQTICDLFPQRQISLRRIGATYGVFNLLAPLLGGVPVCHGCGGLAGHYALGARTGGSVVIYGLIYLTIGLLFSRVFAHVVRVFPLPVLGVVLLFEALVLMLLVRDCARSRRDMLVALLVGLTALTLPQGYLVGVIVGAALYYLSEQLPGVRRRLE